MSTTTLISAADTIELPLAGIGKRFSTLRIVNPAAEPINRNYSSSFMELLSVPPDKGMSNQYLPHPL
jgi:hypothetical protein